MPIDHICLSCKKTFTSLGGMDNHCQAKHHMPNPNVCRECQLSFVSPAALQSHLNSSPRHVNDDDSDEYSDQAFEDYSDDSSTEASDDDEPYCQSCKRSFVDKIGLNQHLAYSAKHNWCFDCSRDFACEEDLVKHQNSLAHKERIFRCPFCEKLYKSPSGIAMHIESGCHKMTRHHVTAAAHAMRIVPNISLRTIKGGSAPAPPTNITTYIATEDSFNGKEYECFLCKRTFRSLQGLNAHLNSPAHDADEFKCPKCHVEFKLISGFAQHLESEACGLAARDDVNTFFDDITAQFSRLLRL
ncbi:hypothetical protein CPC08DRAFT_711097 [Agrocybe pediades]|nr:hypothetical protein CPC08DRAFT_711097 [Agrocybe pediades]